MPRNFVTTPGGSGESGSRDVWVIGLVSCLGLVLMAGVAWQLQGRALTGSNDFLQLYCGARLVGTRDLYNRDRIQREQEKAIGGSSAALVYNRLPYYAALLWPLGRLPYRTAYFVWEALAIGAAAGFVVLWRYPSASVPLPFSCFFLPLFHNFVIGQDLSFILLWIAVSLWCDRKGRPFAAGLVFSLCAAKFHLFFLLPVLIVAQRKWRFASGLAAGGAILLAASFAAAGWSWPVEYYRALATQADPGVTQMPNLHGLMAGGPSMRVLLGIASIVVVLATGIVARRMPPEYSLAAVLAGSLLVSYHSYMQDCTILLPAALIIVSSTRFRVLRFVAVVLLTPVAYFLLLKSPSLAAVAQLTFLSFLLLMTVEAWRNSRAGAVLEAPALQRIGLRLWDD